MIFKNYSEIHYIWKFFSKSLTHLLIQVLCLSFLPDLVFNYVKIILKMSDMNSPLVLLGAVPKPS